MVRRADRRSPDGSKVPKPIEVPRGDRWSPRRQMVPQATDGPPGDRGYPRRTEGPPDGPKVPQTDRRSPEGRERAEPGKVVEGREVVD